MLLPIVKCRVNRKVHFEETEANTAKPVKNTASIPGRPEYCDIRKDSRGRKVFVAHRAPCYGTSTNGGGKGGLEDVKKNGNGGGNAGEKKEEPKANGAANGNGGGGNGGDDEKVNSCCVQRAIERATNSHIHNRKPRSGRQTKTTNSRH